MMMLILSDIVIGNDVVSWIRANIHYKAGIIGMTVVADVLPYSCGWRSGRQRFNQLPDRDHFYFAYIKVGGIARRKKWD